MRWIAVLVVSLACSVDAPAQTDPSKRPAPAAVRAEYRQRAARLDAASEPDLAARLELARWCQERGLLAEMRKQAAAVLAREPQHAAAHALLGHELVAGKWLTQEAAMRERGYVRYRGQWMRLYDAAVAEHREQQAREREKIVAELNQQLRLLASSAAATRERALGRIEEVTTRREWPEVARVAREYKAACDDFWRRNRVTATLSLQHSELLSLQPFTTSLGTGSPVTLQLPRVRTISLGTTVVLPAGSGR